jgi:quercetin dioxygenase-like cupin family protein
MNPPSPQVEREAVMIYRWSQIPEERVNSLASRQMLHTETMSVVRRQLSKGAVIRLHRHADEQISMVECGKVRFVVDGEEEIVASGETYVIPPSAPHSVEALEDSVVMDLFSTPRH